LWPQFGQCVEGSVRANDPIAQLAYPSRPIHLIVPWPPQGGADLLARLLADRLSVSLRQRVTVENRPGGGGNSGAEFVAKSRPDGYVLLVSAGDTHVINPVIYGTQMPFKGISAFAPIALLAYSDFALAVNPTVNLASVEELIARAKRDSNVRMASSGPGTRGHLLALMLQQRAAVDIQVITHSGSAAAAIAVAGGSADAVFSSYSAMAAQVKAGKLKLVAVSSRRQGSGLPAFGALLSEFELELYFGLFAPKGTPREIVQRLNLHANRALEARSARTTLLAMGFEPEPASADAFQRQLAVDSVRWPRALAGMRLVAD